MKVVPRRVDGILLPVHPAFVLRAQFQTTTRTRRPCYMAVHPAFDLASPFEQKYGVAPVGVV